MFPEVTRYPPPLSIIKFSPTCLDMLEKNCFVQIFPHRFLLIWPRLERISVYFSNPTQPSPPQRIQNSKKLKKWNDTTVFTNLRSLNMNISLPFWSGPSPTFVPPSTPHPFGERAEFKYRLTFWIRLFCIHILQIFGNLKVSSEHKRVESRK